MNGAVVRKHPDKPSEIIRFAEDAICECNATAVNAIQPRTVGKKNYDCFEGCPLLLQGRIECVPAEWGLIQWPSIPVFADEKAAVCFLQADKLMQSPGKKNVLTPSGITRKEVD